MRRVLQRCAALDVHKKQLTACGRIVGRDGALEELTAEFSNEGQERQIGCLTSTAA